MTPPRSCRRIHFSYSNSLRWSRPAFTRRDTVVVVLIVIIAAAVCFQVFTVGTDHRRTRSWCPANLKGIGTAMYTYANENADIWPVPPHLPATEEGLGNVTYAPQRIGIKRDATTPLQAGGSSVNDRELSTTRAFWMLVRTKHCTPKSFYCPSSDDEPNDEDNPQSFWDFRSYKEVSYGMQVSFGKKGKPSSDCDARMALVADKGPFGEALELGKSSPGAAMPDSQGGPGDWMRWNSPNHDREGEVVLYADCHAEFQPRPTAGIDEDNIYTRWAGAEGSIKANWSARAHGLPPTGRETPWSDTDSLIYP